MDLGLREKVALVLAANKGLGRACSQARPIRSRRGTEPEKGPRRFLEGKEHKTAYRRDRVSAGARAGGAGRARA